MIQYGLTIENQKLIVAKASTKNNGIYKFRGVVYLVHNNRAKHFACGGKVLENYGSFNAVIGGYDGGEINAMRCLKNIQRQL